MFSKKDQKILVAVLLLTWILGATGSIVKAQASSITNLVNADIDIIETTISPVRASAHSWELTDPNTDFITIPAFEDWQAGIVAFSHGSEGEWDHYLWGGFANSLIKKGNTYYLYYQGSPSYDDQCDSVTHRGIGLATSTDGTNWVKSAKNPVISWSSQGSVEEGAASSAAWVGNDGRIYIYYGANTGSGCTVNSSARLAVSEDGEYFQDLGEVLSGSDPNVWGFGDEIYPVGAYSYENQWHLYYIPNGVSLSKKLGIAVGGNYDSFTQTMGLNDSSIASWGPISIILNGADAVLFTNPNGVNGPINIYRFNAGNPSVVNLYDSYTLPSCTQSSVIYDSSAERWFMSCRDTGAENYLIRFASHTVEKTATPTPTDTASYTPSQTFTPTWVPSNTMTSSSTPTDTPTQTPSSTPTATLLPSNTPTVPFTSTSTPSQTPSFTPTATLSPSNTPIDTLTSTSTPSQTPSSAPSATLSPSNTPTDPFTPTSTPSQTPSFTPTATLTPSNTPTDPFTPTSTPSQTPSSTPSATLTPSNTPIDPLTSTLTPSSTSTSTFTPTLAATHTNTSTNTPTPFPSNLALNKSVSVSSYQDSSHTGDMAADGNLGTYWQSKKTTGKNVLPSEWIVVDLENTATITSFELEWAANYATSYSIQLSNDGTFWTTVFSTNTGNGGNDTIQLGSFFGRYVRMESTAWSSSSLRNWLREFEIFGYYSLPMATNTPLPTDTPIPTPTPGPTITTTPTPTSISSTSIHVGDIDGSTQTIGKNWRALAVITIHDNNHSPVANATVTGIWSDGNTGSCTTDVTGSCTITSGKLASGINTATFAISDVTCSLMPYMVIDNHDLDDDSNGSSITIQKP